MSVNSGFPWRDNDIRRGLMLVRTSNNASNHVNVEVLTQKVDDLSIAAKRELALLLVHIAQDLDPRIKARVDVGYLSVEAVPLIDATRMTPAMQSKLTWHYVSAAVQNPNSHKLQGWFPSVALAQRHVSSWPASISNGMKILNQRDAPESTIGSLAAPNDLQRRVAAELYAFLQANDLQPSKHMNGAAIKIAENELGRPKQRHTVLVAVEHDLYETGDPDAPDAIKDANGEVVLGLCKVCNKGEVELSEPCAPKTDKTPPICETESAAEDEGTQPFRPPVARWVIQEHCNGVWASIGAQLSNEDDAERRLEAMERADLTGKFVYRYRRVK